VWVWVCHREFQKSNDHQLFVLSKKHSIIRKKDDPFVNE
jgi:hypothetical protein